MDNRQATESAAPAVRPAKWKNLVKAVAFLVLFGLIFLRVQDVVVPNRDVPSKDLRLKKTNYSLINEEKDSIDVVWVGSSHVHHGISPMEIYRNSQIRSYNIAANTQSFGIAYYRLREMFKTQSPKLVMVDVSSLFHAASIQREKSRWQESIDALPLSWVKTRLEMGMELARNRNEPFDEEYFYLTVLPLLEYHTNIELTEEEYYNLHLEQLYEKKGYVMYAGTDPVPWAEMSAVKERLNPEDKEAAAAENYELYTRQINVNLDDLKRLQELCKANDCEMMLLKVPIYRTKETYHSYWDWGKHEATRRLAEEMGVDFLDMHYENVGLNWRADTKDSGIHLNVKGAVKVSKYLAKWLKKNRDIGTPATPELTARWDAQLAVYDGEKANSLLRLETNVKRYFKRLSQGDYTLLAFVSGEVFETWSDELQDYFTNLTGCELDLRSPDNAALALVSRGGEVLDIASGADSAKVKGELPGGVAYKLKSRRNLKEASMEVGGQKVPPKMKQGLLIAAYDNTLHCLVDINFLWADPETGEATCVHSNTQIKDEIKIKQAERAYEMLAGI